MRRFKFFPFRLLVLTFFLPVLLAFRLPARAEGTAAFTREDLNGLLEYVADHRRLDKAPDGSGRDIWKFPDGRESGRKFGPDGEGVSVWASDALGQLVGRDDGSRLDVIDPHGQIVGYIDLGSILAGNPGAFRDRFLLTFPERQIFVLGGREKAAGEPDGGKSGPGGDGEKEKRAVYRVYVFKPGRIVSVKLFEPKKVTGLVPAGDAIVVIGENLELYRLNLDGRLYLSFHDWFLGQHPALH